MRTAVSMAQLADEWESEIYVLAAEVRAVVGGSWQSAPADTHADAWRDWFTAIGNMIGALRDDAAALQEAAADYRSTDDATSHTIHHATLPLARPL
jgi:uncharacterized protein YukE